MKVSEILLKKIEEFEGCRLTAYKCPAGVWTIGMGHTRGVKAGQKITKAQAVTLLKGDLLPIENYLNSMRYEWTQGKFDACADFCFNLGTTAFMNSTLRKKIMLNAPKGEIEAAFKAWVKAKVNGKYETMPGLVKRREWEAKRFFS